MMTRRALLLGLAMAAWVNLWAAYSTNVIRSSQFAFSHLSAAFLIPFLILLGFNRLLERRGGGLSPSELLIVCCVGMVAANMQGEWLSDYFLLVITQVTYWANPENGWEALMLPHIPTWSIVTDRAAIVPFYEGMLGTGSIPWRAWATPFFWWGTFFGALLLASFCLSILLRKQWMEHERLAFPIAAVLLELTGVSGSRGTLQALVRTPLFRIGFWSVFGLLTWNMGSWFAPALPVIPMLVRHTVPIARGFPSFRFKILPMTIGFGYFTRSEVLLSIWLFHLLAILQVGILNRVGFDMGSSDPWCSFHPAIGWQSFGGMIIFVAWGLWIARAHLGEVFKAALTLRRTDRDRSELMSYRWAVRLLIASSGYMVLWLRQAGMEWGPLFAFGLASGILYLGLARIIVESGLVYLRGPITSQAFTWHLFGMTGMGPASAVVLGGLSYTFFCDAKTFGMTMLAHVPRLGDAMSVRYRRGLVPAVLLGALVGAATVVWFTLYQGYLGVGSYNFGSALFYRRGDPGGGMWTFAAARIQQGDLQVGWDRLGFLGIGGAFVALLFGLRTWFPAFPISPIGFTISASGVLRNSISSIFIVWLTKVLILKLGGLDRYRRAAPLFLGIIIGYLAAIALGVAVDFVCFPQNGHEINTW